MAELSEAEVVLDVMAGRWILEYRCCLEHDEWHPVLVDFKEDPRRIVYIFDDKASATAAMAVVATVLGGDPNAALMRLRVRPTSQTRDGLQRTTRVHLTTCPFPISYYLK